MSSSKVSLKSLTTASIVIITATGIYLLHNNKKEKHDHSTTPRQLKDSPYVNELELAVLLAKRAGENMKGYVDSK
jgi:hypothetical protein